MEIEKKYKVKTLPEGYENYPCKQIEQGYLCENPVIRIRKSNEEYILTYKSRFGLEEKDEKAARVSHEVEVPLNKEGYEHLRKKADGNLILKKRFVLPLKNHLKAELDIFEGCLSGLVIVEVEFATEEEAEGFEPPEWFAEEVTFDHRFANKNMIAFNSLEEMEK